MVPTVNEAKNQPLEVAEFYDLLAPDYDAMTGFDQRFVRESPYFRLLVERYRIRSALDAGCGSGFHSLLLSQLGVQVTGVDASPEMVRLTSKHAKKAGAKIKVLTGSFVNLDVVLKGPFDAIFVMGNSVAHLLSKHELKKAIKVFSGLLSDEGILFIQCLNYERILATREKVLSTKETGEKKFVRTYEYDDEGILFNIHTIKKGSPEGEGKTAQVRLRPVMREELTAMLVEEGFPHVNIFGGISMEQFDPSKSNDLVVLSRKNH